MIRAAIAGLGRWGRNLVTATVGSESIRFVATHTRDPATAAGKAVFVEKPFALTLADAEAMADAAER